MRLLKGHYGSLVNGGNNVIAVYGFWTLFPSFFLHANDQDYYSSLLLVLACNKKRIHRNVMKCPLKIRYVVGVLSSFLGISLRIKNIMHKESNFPEDIIIMPDKKLMYLESSSRYGQRLIINKINPK